MSNTAILDGSADYIEGHAYLLYHLLVLCIVQRYTSMFWTEGGSKTFATNDRDDVIELFEHGLAGERKAMISGLTESVHGLCDAEYSAKPEGVFVVKLHGNDVRTFAAFESDASAGTRTIRLRPQYDPQPEIFQSARDALQSFVRTNRHMARNIRGPHVVLEYIEPSTSARPPWMSRILRKMGKLLHAVIRREMHPESASEELPV